MFDIGFFELVIIATVALLVIGPERLPGAVRTASGYLRRIRRSFNEIRQEVERELRNDEVMQNLKQTRDQITGEADQWRREFSETEDRLQRDLKKSTGDANTSSRSTSDSNDLKDAAAQSPGPANSGPVQPRPENGQGRRESGGDD